MTNRILTSVLRMLALVVVVLAAAVATPSTPAAAGTDTCRFKVLNASPDAPPLDFYVNNTRVATGLTYTKFSGLWAIAAGTTPIIRVFPTGSDPNTTQPSARGEFQCEVGKTYVIAAADFFQALKVVVFTMPDRPPAGLFTLSAAHLAAGTGPVDITKSDGTIIPSLDNIPFLGFKSTNQSPGTYDLQIRQAGTPNVLVTFPPQNFAANRQYTIYIFDAGGLQAKAVAGAPKFLIVRER